jgi:hypothetical protein
MRHVLLLATILLAAGCSVLRSDLSGAEAPCHNRKFSTKTEFVQCLAAQERPVWAKDEPATLDLYDAYDGQRAALAQKRDRDELTEDQYRSDLETLGTEMRQRIAERRRALRSSP